jgi:hypothetical protein
VRTVAESDMLDALKNEISLVIEERQQGGAEDEAATRYRPARPSLRLTSV